MKINEIKILNYRNLNNVNIDFHNQINFIVGENNLGKTNILELLHIIFNRRAFQKTDFNEQDKPIKIELKLLLEQGEIGLFDDYFTLDEQEKLVYVEVEVLQQSIDDNIEFSIKSTNDDIHRNKIRKAHFISYGSVRRPEKELSFAVQSNFLHLLIKKYLEENEGEFNLDTDSFSPLIQRINHQLEQIKTFNLFDLEAKANEDISGLLGNIIQLQAKNKFDISDLSEGTQFINSIPLVLLNQIAKIIERDIDGSILEVEGKRKLYVIISIDEPELHLHPHTQRFFIDYLQEVLSGKSDEFNSLLKFMYGIDEISGQLLIVTHSPYILLDDYKSIVRVYYEHNQLKALSGISIDIEQSLMTHMFRYLDEIKEAFYAKKVLVVEGVTEQGAMKALFEKERIDINLAGISVVNAHGKDSVPYIVDLFNKFKVPVVGFIDRDENNPEDVKYKYIDNLFYTELKEFENDIVECLDLDGYIDYLKKNEFNIVNPTIALCKKYGIDVDPSNIEEYELQIKNQPRELKENIMTELKGNIIHSLTQNKTFINGFLISKYAHTTPSSIKKAFDCLVDIDG